MAEQDNDLLITITKERYQKMQRRLSKLDKLEAAGVDNWEGYADAMSMDDE